MEIPLDVIHIINTDNINFYLTCRYLHSFLYYFYDDHHLNANILPKYMPYVQQKLKGNCYNQELTLLTSQSYDLDTYNIITQKIKHIKNITLDTYKYLFHFNNLESIKFDIFNQPLFDLFIKFNNIKVLELSCIFDQDISTLPNLSSLTSLSLHFEAKVGINQILEQTPNLTYLSVGYNFCEEIKGLYACRDTLKTLIFREDYAHSIDNILQESTALTYLDTGNNRNITFTHTPKTLKYLSIGGYANRWSRRETDGSAIFRNAVGLETLTVLNSHNVLFDNLYNSTITLRKIKVDIAGFDANKLIDNALNLEDIEISRVTQDIDINSPSLLSINIRIEQYQIKIVAPKLHTLKLYVENNDSIDISTPKVTDLTINSKSMKVVNYVIEQCCDVVTLTVENIVLLPKAIFNCLKTLKYLSFGYGFNDYLDPLLLRDNIIEILNTGFSFCRPFKSDQLKTGSLKKLNLGHFFSYPIENILRNSSKLKTLKLSKEFDLPIKNLGKAAQSLHTISFGGNFNQDISSLIKSATSLKTLIFGNDFDQSLDCLAESTTSFTLNTLELGSDFEQNLNRMLPKMVNLTQLKLNQNYKCPIDTRFTSLKIIKYGNQEIRL